MEPLPTAPNLKIAFVEALNVAVAPVFAYDGSALVMTIVRPAPVMALPVLSLPGPRPHDLQSQSGGHI